MKRLQSLCGALVMSAACVLWAATAQAGPILIGGDDADDHGSANSAGWLYIEDGFDLLGPAVGNGNRVVVCLGCNGGQATAAFLTAFAASDLVAAGWTTEIVAGAAAIQNYFNNAGPTTLSETGIIYMPTDAQQVSGGITNAELVVVNANALLINGHVAGPGSDPVLGGGLFAHSQINSPVGYGWLTALIPGLIPTGDCNSLALCNDGQLFLTPAGTLAFPQLTNAILSNATPWHSWFTGNLGGLQVLTEGIINSTTGVRAPVIIGGGAGTTIVPEPATLTVLGIGLLAGGRRLWRRERRTPRA